MLESKIEKDVTKYAELLGWLAYKFTSPGCRAVPDHIYFKEGHTILIEFKQLNKKPSKLQARQIAKIQEQLIHVYVVDSIQSGKDIFNAY